MKRFIALLVTALLLTGGALAVGIPAEEKSAALLEAEQYAWLDLDTASPELQEKILDARNLIIRSTEWVADGYSMYVGDVRTGEIIREIPKFSEVFPGWDPPEPDPSLILAPSGSSIPEEPYDDVRLHPLYPTLSELRPFGLSEWIEAFTLSPYLDKAVEGVEADPYVTFLVDWADLGSDIRTYATLLTSSETCNIGYSNASTGADLGAGMELKPYEYCQVNNVAGMNLSIRASTLSLPGYATLRTEGSNRIGSVK